MYQFILRFGCFWLFTSLLLATMQAQFGRYPDNGKAGVHGTIPGSYVISWRSLPEAVGYEYVLSDNPQCFEGCAGDTRQEFVRDTAAIEFNLAPNKFYYWILRTYFANGDTSEWTLIYSFTTEETDFNRRMIVAAPTRVEDDVLRLRLDWAQYPEANFVDLELVSLDGKATGGLSYRTQRRLSRYQTIEWPLPHLGPGTYLVRALIGEGDGLRSIQYWVRFQLL